MTKPRTVPPLATISLKTRNFDSRNSSREVLNLAGRAAGRACRNRSFAIASAYDMRGNGIVMSRPISLEDVAHQRLDDAEDRLRPRERHLDVDLRELGLAVGAQVLVAEALADLHVAVDARRSSGSA